jgi:opacity protein-like surface antigen
MLATLGTVHAQSYFARAQAVAVFPAKGHLDNTAGIDVVIGSAIGANKEHEFSLGLGAIHWSESSNYWNSFRVTVDSSNNTTTIRIGDRTYQISTDDNKVTITGDYARLPDGTIQQTHYQPSLDVAPVLASYRYYTGDQNARVRIFVGGGLGIARVQARARVWGHSYQSETDSAWKFAWDGTAGVAIKLTERLKLDFAYAYQEIDGATLNLGNVSYNFEPLKTSMLKGGVTWQF